MTAAPTARVRVESATSRAPDHVTVILLMTPPPIRPSHEMLVEMDWIASRSDGAFDDSGGKESGFDARVAILSIR
jgi:hypothetical protein